jgi:hypothetical protein
MSSRMRQAGKGGARRRRGRPVRLSYAELAAGAPELAAFDQALTVNGASAATVSPSASIRSRSSRRWARAAGRASAPPGAACGRRRPSAPSARRVPGHRRRRTLMAFFDGLVADLFGGPRKVDAAPPEAAIPMLAHWLPYRSFDPKTQLYYNNASRGFILEISPLVGADDRTSEIIAQFLSEGIPERTCIQIVQWQSPRVSGKIGMWFMPRSDAGGIYERMAQHRCDHINGVWASLSRDAPSTCARTA